MMLIFTSSAIASQLYTGTYRGSFPRGASEVRRDGSVMDNTTTTFTAFSTAAAGRQKRVSCRVTVSGAYEVYANTTSGVVAFNFTHDPRLDYLDATISSRVTASDLSPTLNSLHDDLWAVGQSVENIGYPLQSNDSRITRQTAAFGTFSTMLHNKPTGGGGATPAEIWAYNGGRTVDGVQFNYSTLAAGISSKSKPVSVLPFQGAASYDTVAQGKEIHVMHGDSVAIPFTISKDLTGYTVWFGVRANPTDASYAITARNITTDLTDVTHGSGLINLTTTETAIAPKKYFAEVEIRKAGSVNTVLRFYLWIDSDIIH